MAQGARISVRGKVGQTGSHRTNTQDRVPFVGARGASLPSRAPQFFNVSMPQTVLRAWS